MYASFFSTYLVFLGLVGVVASPSPSWAALSLVLGAVGGCGLLVYVGKTFLSLILLLIYLGGMLVVFSFSLVFFVDSSGENSNKGFNFKWITACAFSLLWGLALFTEGKEEFWMLEEKINGGNLVLGDEVGVGFLYAEGGVFLILGALALLLVMLVILLIVKNISSMVIRWF